MSKKIFKNDENYLLNTNDSNICFVTTSDNNNNANKVLNNYTVILRLVYNFRSTM